MELHPEMGVIPTFAFYVVLYLEVTRLLAMVGMPQWAILSFNRKITEFYCFWGGGGQAIYAGKSAGPYAGGVQGMQRSHADWLWGCGFLESAQSGKSLCGIGVAGVDPQDFPVKPLCRAAESSYPAGASGADCPDTCRRLPW